MSISYSKVVCIKQDVAEVVRKKVKDNSYVFILPAFHPCRMFLSQLTTWIDILILQMTNDSYMALRLSSFKKMEPKFGNDENGIKRSSRLHKKSDQMLLYPPLFPEPKKEKEHFAHTSNTITLDVIWKHDIVWSMMKSQLDIAKLVPTRASYYKPLITDIFQNTTKSSSLPVINGSPTDWLNLYTVIKIVQNIKIICTLQEKTIIH